MMSFFSNVKTTTAIYAVLASGMGALASGDDIHCSDDPFYAYQGKYCDEIAYTNHCDTKLGNGDIIGEVFCPVSCDKCSKHYDTSYILLSQSCFLYGEDIVVFYANTDPHETDVIAIFHPDEYEFDRSPILWDWLCGDDDGYYCKASYGEKVLNGHYSFGKWPLDHGYYQIVLKMAGPEQVAFATSEFEVGNCDGDRTPYPTLKPTEYSYPAPAESGNHYYPTSKPTPKPTDHYYPTPAESGNHYYPSSKPTPKPVDHFYPTPSPVDHSVCYDQVFTESSCFMKGQEIAVGFYQCNPRPDDWIGIYYSDEDKDALPFEYFPWQFACGSQACSEAIKEGEVYFTDALLGHWPLEPGEYVAFLIRENNAPPYSSYAQSYPFVVVEYGDICYHHTMYPSPSPVEHHYPTHKPSPSPTKINHYPTPSPTLYDHTSCTYSVSTDMTCYDGAHDTVVVEYVDCDPNSKDWLGIYDASDDPKYLGEPLVYVWTACGSYEECTINIEYTFLNEYGKAEFGGLPIGQYRAHLVKHVYPFPHYVAEASSDVFYVKSKCDYEW